MRIVVDTSDASDALIESMESWVFAQARHPSGGSKGGQFKSTGAGKGKGRGAKGAAGAKAGEFDTPEEWAEGMSPRESGAIKHWQGGSDEIREAYIMDEGEMKLKGDFDDAINRSPNFEGTAYRGMYDVDKDVADSTFVKGAVVTFPAPASATTSASVAKDFSGVSEFGVGVQMKIQTKSGVKINGATKKEYAHEMEVIIKPGSKYVVKGKPKYAGNVLQVTMVER